MKFNELDLFGFIFDIVHTYFFRTLTFVHVTESAVIR